MTDKVRKTAWVILNRVDQKRETLDSIMDDVFAQDALFSKRDKALLQTLVYGVLRWRGSLDRMIEKFSKTPMDRIEAEILNVLRLGLFQIIYLDKIPVFAAVNTSVEIAKSFAAPWTVKFVNGLLRNIIRTVDKQIDNRIDNHNFSSQFSVLDSFPKWLVRRWGKRFGIKETEMLCEAFNTIPPITLRANTLKTTRDQLIHALESHVKTIEPAPYAPNGISFFHPTMPVSEMASFQNGWFQVQDEAAQLVTCLLNPQPGDTVLDACAAPGGKTGHIAQMMKNSGRIVSVDKDEKKLQKLESEINRLGISIVKTCPHDLNVPSATSHFSLLTSHSFDRILLDAPCSGLGVLRRNPDTKWSVSEKDLIRYQKKQIKFLNHLAHLVKSSGILVYAVCSMEPEENEAVVHAFLNKNTEFVLEKSHEGLPATACSLINSDGYLKTFPHLNQMDGFFAACFKRKI